MLVFQHHRLEAFFSWTFWVFSSVLTWFLRFLPFSFEYQYVGYFVFFTGSLDSRQTQANQHVNSGLLLPSSADMDYFKRLKKEKKRAKKEPWRRDRNLRVQSEVSTFGGLNWQLSKLSFWLSTFSPVGRILTEWEHCNFSCSRQETRCSLVITGPQYRSLSGEEVGSTVLQKQYTFAR